MNITLYGSKTSPFVRRVSLFFIENNIDYKLELVNVYDANQLSSYENQTPTLRVPCVEIDGNIIWDSYLILKYIQGKEFSLEQEKLMFLINDANDAGVYLAQAKIFRVDENHQGVPSQNAQRRLQAILNYFESKPALLTWDTVGVWLFCLLDFLMFIKVHELDMANHPNLVEFHQQQLQRNSVQQTSPSLA